MDERLKRQLDFALEIDKEKNILRQTHLSEHGRRENDAEHAWHMAIMAYLFREHSNESVDIAKVMLMCLIHDIVEIDAGDTYAYDTEGLKTQKAREDAAKERIFSILPEDQKQELISLFDEFEAFETAESKFAHAMDNLQPLMLITAMVEMIGKSMECMLSRFMAVRERRVWDQKRYSKLWIRSFRRI